MMPPAEKTNPSLERLHNALVVLIGEVGYREVRREELLERAEVDRDTYEAHYESLDECFAEVWESLTRVFVERAFLAFSLTESWRDGMRAQAWKYCEFLEEDHLRARICMVEIAFGGEPVQARRDNFMSGYVELVHRGRCEREPETEPGREIAEGIVGAIWERAATTVGVGSFDRLAEEVPQLMYLMMLPYLGPEIAREELRRGPQDIAAYRRGEVPSWPEKR
jgi:hypothetical protein